MNELIKINYETETPTVSARDLYTGLEIKSNFTTWFDRMSEYGFEDTKDFFPKKEESTGGRPAVDYEISVDMAKQICMIQRSEKGKQYRQYFLDLEKAWNTPEQVFARALRMADKEIEKLKKENIEDSEVNALELVNRMQVRQFDWKIGGHQNIGFVADELEKIDPNLTLGGGYDENGEMNVKQINSPYLLNYAIKAIQELSVVVENQNKHIEELKRRLS